MYEKTENILKAIEDAVRAGKKTQIKGLIQTALDEKIQAKVILEQALLAALQGEDQSEDIPKILAVSRCLQAGLDLLEPYLARPVRRYNGKIILGTIEGDLHDIGKNLVATMMRGFQFEVVDLGVDVSPRQFIHALRRHPDASIVALSCLLSTSYREMQRTVQSLRNTKNIPRVKIMVGGGGITRQFADKIQADAYTATALEAVEMARILIEKDQDAI